MTSKKNQPSAKAAKGEDKWNIHTPSMNVNWCNRTLCGTLNDIRTCLKVLKERDQYPESAVHILHSLLEEIQVYANRMESALDDLKSSEKLRDEYKLMKKELETLYEEKPNLKPERGSRWDS